MKLYGKLAWFWEMSDLEEYKIEAELVVKMIKRLKKTKGNELLDVGCGAGHHHRFMKGYKITGVDASKSMLEIARRNNSTISYERGRMQNFDLGRRFDAVVALDCLSYNLDLKSLDTTIGNLSKHLKRGGVLMFTVDEVTDTFIQNDTKITKRSNDEKTLVLVENSFDSNVDDTQYDLTLIFMIRENGELTIEIDEHKLGLFQLDDMLDIVRRNGLRAHLYDSDFSGRKYKKKGPLFVCEKIR